MMSTLIRDVAGLTAIENSVGTFVFGSDFSNGTFGSFIYNIKTGTYRNLSVSALADKCVWSEINTNDIYCAVTTSTPNGTLPDDWYQGNIFLDANNIWKIDATTGVTNVVDFLSERNTNIDAIDLSLNQKENWLSFMNKKDLTLWALQINQ